jgi:hypothetical protein
LTTTGQQPRWSGKKSEPGHLWPMAALAAQSTTKKQRAKRFMLVLVLVLVLDL